MLIARSVHPLPGEAERKERLLALVDGFSSRRVLIVGDLIDWLRPSLCVVAGPTERRGLQRIASTLIVNPGRLADGSAAWLDWDRSGDDQVEFCTTDAQGAAGIHQRG